MLLRQFLPFNHMQYCKWRLGCQSELQCHSSCNCPMLSCRRLQMSRKQSICHEMLWIWVSIHTMKYIYVYVTLGLQSRLDTKHHHCICVINRCWASEYGRTKHCKNYVQPDEPFRNFRTSINIRRSANFMSCEGFLKLRNCERVRRDVTVYKGFVEDLHRSLRSRSLCTYVSILL